VSFFCHKKKSDLLFLVGIFDRKEVKKMADTGTTKKKLQHTRTSDEMAKDLRVQTQAVEIARIRERYEVMYTLAKYLAHGINPQSKNSELGKIVEDTILSNDDFEVFFIRVNPGQEAILLGARTDIKRREAQKAQKAKKEQEAKVQTATPQ
jgi:hypothetical protein